MLTKPGIPVTYTDIFRTGRAFGWNGFASPQPYAGKVASLRKVWALLAAETRVLEAAIVGVAGNERGH